MTDKKATTIKFKIDHETFDGPIKAWIEPAFGSSPSLTINFVDEAIDREALLIIAEKVHAAVLEGLKEIDEDEKD